MSDLMTFESMENAKSNISSINANVSALDLEELPPTLPIITISFSPDILRSLFRSKNDPKPPIGLDEAFGSDNAEVIPFALFHGINVEFGLKASNMENPIL